MWPFGSNKSNKQDSSGADPADDRTVTPADSRGDGVTGDPGTAARPDGADRGPRGGSVSAGATAATAGGPADDYDPVNGEYGPFDGDSVSYTDFDFSDFAKGGLDLGSIMVPVPHTAEVQVEMGPEGPQMIHVICEHGRLTPVAFAAPRAGGLWQEAIPDIVEGMRADGMTVEVRQGPWGDEVLAEAGDGAMRIIGVDGTRWMLRLTLAGPASSRDALAQLAREVLARTFVVRGTEPIPAGTPLPVTIPAAMAEELQRALAEQQAQAAAEVRDGAPGADAGGAAPASRGPERTGGATPRQQVDGGEPGPGSDAGTGRPAGGAS
ncbi:DUF3710 domain-containing protein [Corynebacterium bovis]|uniref:DUF3710 domain-containing protein n=1 Tax=Corynebacterium bovis TaxID=36808 RepID=UPI00244A4BD6|nr:DUF3710 domain-containing protein [Corynebacterium bovis]MDH2455086.1 DUF3710 domain-containing protein [Corynebacterium bovis]